MGQQHWNSTTLIHSYSVQYWFISTGCNEYEYNFDIKLEHSKYVWFIRLLIQIHEFRKLLIILINGSNDLNHPSKFTVLVVFAFTKKEERKRQMQQTKQIHNLLQSIVVFVLVVRRQKETKTASKGNTQPSTEYCSIRMRIILILWFLKMSIHGFKLWIWVVWVWY